MQPLEDEVPKEDLETAFLPAELPMQLAILTRKQTFAPWHHPSKQVVRDFQWGAHTKKLASKRPAGTQVLRYFTLPGADLFDVKTLAAVCAEFGMQIDYFGFDSGWGPSNGDGADAPQSPDRALWAGAEAELRQAGKTTPYGEVVSDRLEDIAVEASNARAALSRKPIFDIINIDACDHLAYRPSGRERNTFDALKVLLQHQLKATSPWLLFITTRAEPALLGVPGSELLQAIHQNVSAAPEFVAALANLLGGNEATILTDLLKAWTTSGEAFLKLYGLGVAKYLLQFFAAQPNCPANVELVSSFAYRVHGDSPNMTALAFLISPDPVRAVSHKPLLSSPALSLEPQRACAAASRAKLLLNIDAELQRNAAMLERAVSGTETLLGGANYDLSAWRIWVETHPIRPVTLGAVVAGREASPQVDITS